VKEIDMIGTRDKSPRPLKRDPHGGRDPHEGIGPHYPRGPIFGNEPDDGIGGTWDE